MRVFRHDNVILIMNHRHLLILCFSLLLFNSCREQESLQEEVDPIFIPYANDFAKEASLRGLDLADALKEVSIVFGPTQNPFWDGQCNTDERRIIINPISWRNNDDTQKKLTLFHELGHCLLGRDHLNSVLPNGEWESIMRGGQPVGNRSFSTNFSGFREEYYLDELFEVIDVLPKWVKESYDLRPWIKPQYNESFKEKSLGWIASNGSSPFNSDGQTLIITDDEISNLKQEEAKLSDMVNYRIDLTIEILSGSRFTGLIWGANLETEGNYMLINNSGQLVIGSRSNNLPTIQISSEFINAAGINVIAIQRIDEFNYGFINNNFVYRWEASDEQSQSFGITAQPSMEVRLHELNVFLLGD